NAAWKNDYASFDQITTFLPETAVTRRKRLDFADWYMGAMSAWCEQWAMWARQALPDTVIHQSSGGWGPVEIGTDYSYQARGISISAPSHSSTWRLSIPMPRSNSMTSYSATAGAPSFSPWAGRCAKRLISTTPVSK